LGVVPAGEALTRDGARAGDGVFVTGTLGDAAGALRMPRDPGPGTGDLGENGVVLRARLDRPEPRIAAGLALRGIASACIDVSDGLLADLDHVCAGSRVGAEIEVDALPVSPELAASFDAQTCRDLALSGGDDYELCFTVPSAREAEAVEKLARAGCGATRIGRIVAGSGVRVRDADANEIEVAQAGWEHFSQ
jgi:thiamine-monophosphate kinase